MAFSLCFAVLAFFLLSAKPAYAAGSSLFGQTGAVAAPTSHMHINRNISDEIEIKPLLFLFALLYVGFVLGVLTDRLFLRSERKCRSAAPPPPKANNSQSGSIFTILLAAIGIAAALSVVLYQTISGPMSSMVRVTNKTSAKSQMQSVASIIIMDAINNLPNGGDCASAGYVVPRSWRTGTVFPSGGGLIPTTIGAPITDPWGTDYGYCVWEVGVASKAAACDTTNGSDQSCTGINGGNNCTGGAGSGYNAKRLLGTPTPSSSDAISGTVIAIISAGPDRQFQTTCQAYSSTGGTGTETNSVVTAGGDDIVMTFTYAQAATATSSLWTLKPTDSTSAIINKNLAVGPTATPTVTVNATTGLINALGITSQGAIISTAGAIGLASLTTGTLPSCIAGNVGYMYLNTTTNAVDVCTCTGGDCPATGTYSWGPASGSGGGSSLWTLSGNNLYPTTLTNLVGIGTTTPGAQLDVHAASNSGIGLVSTSGGGTLDFLVDTSASGLSSNIGSEIRFIDAGAYGDNIEFLTNASGSEGTTLTPQMIILRGGGVGIGTATPVSELTLAGGHFITPSADSVSAIGFASNAAPTTPTLDIDTTNGRVGIGTTTPGAQLDVHAASNSGIGLVSTSGGGTLDFLVDTSASGLSSNIGSEIRFIDAGAYGDNIEFLTNASGSEGTTLTPQMIILRGGGVGIGTTTPSYPLDILGAAGSNTVMRVTAPASYTSAIWLAQTGDSNQWVIQKPSSDLFQVCQNFIGCYFNIALSPGYVSIGQEGSPASQLAVKGNATIGSGYSETAAPSNGLLVQGNVGIANTSPGALLDLGLAGTTKGVVRLAGNTSGNVTIQPAAIAGTWSMTLPATTGTSGQLLQTDGTGITSWVTSAASIWTHSGTYDYLTTTTDSVGIGTTTPTHAALDVETTGNSAWGIYGTNYSGTSAGLGTNGGVYGTTAVGGSTSAGVYGSATNGGIGGYFTSTSGFALITGTGNVGIGTAAPGAKLSLGAVTGSDLIRVYDGGGTSNYGWGMNAAELQSFVPATAHFSFNSGGTLQASGTNEIMRITSAGNVGIGTASPGGVLDTYLANTTNVNAPATSGATQNNSIARFETNRVVGLDIGAQYASPWGIWLQVTQPNSLGAYYPLLLNPNGGNVGVGTTTPAMPLDVYSATGGINVIRGYATGSGSNGVYGVSTNTGGVGVVGNGSTTSGYGGEFNGFYGLQASNEAGLWTQLASSGYGAISNGNAFFNDVYLSDISCWASSCGPSDIRLKKDIKLVEGALDTILKLKPVSFYWKREKGNLQLVTDGSKRARSYGFIAQDVEKVLPDIVKHMKMPPVLPGKKPDPNVPKEGYLGLDYNGLIAPTVKAVQELYGKWSTDHDELAVLKADNDNEAAEIKQLKADNDNLRSLVAAQGRAIEGLKKAQAQ